MSEQKIISKLPYFKLSTKTGEQYFFIANQFRYCDLDVFVVFPCDENFNVSKDEKYDFLCKREDGSFFFPDVNLATALILRYKYSICQ